MLPPCLYLFLNTIFSASFSLLFLLKIKCVHLFLDHRIPTKLSFPQSSHASSWLPLQHLPVSFFYHFPSFLSLFQFFLCVLSIYSFFFSFPVLRPLLFTRILASSPINSDFLPRHRLVSPPPCPLVTWSWSWCVRWPNSGARRVCWRPAGRPSSWLAVPRAFRPPRRCPYFLKAPSRASTGPGSTDIAPSLEKNKTLPAFLFIFWLCFDFFLHFVPIRQLGSGTVPVCIFFLVEGRRIRGAEFPGPAVTLCFSILPFAIEGIGLRFSVFEPEMQQKLHCCCNQAHWDF